MHRTASIYDASKLNTLDAILDIAIRLDGRTRIAVFYSAECMKTSKFYNCNYDTLSANTFGH